MRPRELTLLATFSPTFSTPTPTKRTRFFCTVDFLLFGVFPFLGRFIGIGFGAGLAGVGGLEI